MNVLRQSRFLLINLVINLVKHCWHLPNQKNGLACSKIELLLEKFVPLKPGQNNYGSQSWWKPITCWKSTDLLGNSLNFRRPFDSHTPDEYPFDANFKSQIYSRLSRRWKALAARWFRRPFRGYATRRDVWDSGYGKLSRGTYSKVLCWGKETKCFLNINWNVPNRKKRKYRTYFAFSFKYSACY